VKRHCVGVAYVTPFRIDVCVDALTCRVRGAFSVHQARRIQRTVSARSQPVQEHVRARSPASDAGDHRLRRSARSESSSDGDAVPSRRQRLQGMIYALPQRNLYSAAGCHFNDHLINYSLEVLIGYRFPYFKIPPAYYLLITLR